MQWRRKERRKAEHTKNIIDEKRLTDQLHR